MATERVVNKTERESDRRENRKQNRLKGSLAPKSVVNKTHTQRRKALSQTERLMSYKLQKRKFAANRQISSAQIKKKVHLLTNFRG